MTKFTIHELQNLQSVRVGFEYEGTLRAAKTFATKTQTFQGTVLKIQDETGTVIAIKDINTGNWYDPRDFE